MPPHANIIHYSLFVIRYSLSERSERFCVSADSGILRAANFFGGRPQDADAAKEENLKGRGAAPPPKVLLF